MINHPEYRRYFIWPVVVGFSLVLLILLLGISFFYALNKTQTDSKKEFLRKQTELAAIDLEREIDRFIDFANAIGEEHDELDLDSGSYDFDFTKSVRRIFNNYPGLIDTLVVNFKDSAIFITQTPRNDFIRSTYPNDLEYLIQSDYLLRITGKSNGIRLYFKLNPAAFTKDFVKNYYLNPLSSKLLFLNGQLENIDPGTNPQLVELSSTSLEPIYADINIGVLGVYQVGWNAGGTEKDGLLVQYPFRFGSIVPNAALLFMLESDSITSGVYSTYILWFLGLVLVIVGIVVLFTLFLKNRIESERLLQARSKEISELFDQQNLLLKELRGFVYFHDSKGVITRVSDEVIEVLGISKEDFLAAFQDGNMHKDANRIRVLIKQAIQDKVSFIDFEHNYIKGSGEGVYLRVFEKLVFDPQGNFMGGVGICTDMTSQHLARQELVQSEKRLRTLIDNIPDLIFIYDNEGVIIDYQVQITELFIDQELELIGKKINEVVPNDQGEELFKAFKLARKTGKIQTVDLKTMVGAEERYYEVRMFSLDENKMMSISKDITSQRIWEKGLLEAMNAADQASKAKSEFLANMSHEIRTPMNGLLGIIDLLDQTELDQIQSEYLEIIKNSGNSLLNIIRDILDYSKIESGKIEICNTVFIPKVELKKHVQMLSGLAKKKNIEISISFSDKTAIPLEGDIEKIKQVFLNLLGNALKFTPINGKVYIKVDSETISDELVFLNISVKDTGIGISSEFIPHLTNPFFQVESSNTRSFQGTGLGLAISKRIVELLGGELQIQSEVGKGSEFSFSTLLKISSDQVTDQQVKLDQKPNTWNNMAQEYPLRILLAEDNDLNLQLMTLMLDQLGYKFTIAQNGQEAVKLVSENDFDLILMDVQMPILNGLEASRIIRTMPEGKNIFIIGLSANVFDEDRKKAIESGMNDYLTKPIRLYSLAQKLKIFASKILLDEN